MAHMLKKRLKGGVGLLEIIVAVAILSTALGSIVVTYSMYLRAALLNTENIQATYLAEEGMEAVRILRDTSWTNEIETLALGTNYYLTYATTTKSWVASTTPEYNSIDGTFERTVMFSAVMRDSTDDIVASGGTNDPDARLVKVTVSWPQGAGTTTKSLSGYLTNLFAN